ncbi:MAG: glycosyltransferase, partial [Proteobacteria bacterium]|nr:glycosyltransferase [Pseudomonadota bacterium]
MTAPSTIDVIVPIYNAYEDVVTCIASVRRHTRPERYRLILIDDKSPDPRIGTYLESLRRVRALEPELLITGHFEPIAGRELVGTCLERLDRAVDYVHRSTLEGMNAGKDVFTLMREVQLPTELYV